MTIFVGTTRIPDIRTGTTPIQRVYEDNTVIWERFDEFAFSLRSDPQVLGYTQGIAADFAYAAGNPHAYFPPDGTGTELSTWKRGVPDYDLVWNRLRISTLNPNLIQILFNRDFDRSNGDDVTNWHGDPGDPEVYNYSVTRIMHVINYDRQQQFVLGDDTSPDEVNAVGGGFFRFRVIPGNNINVPNSVNAREFILGLEEARFLIVVAHADWRAF